MSDCTRNGTYFYEEDNWVDDMELAAIEFYNLTGEKKYLEYATEFGRKELVTPWMGKDTLPAITSGTLL